MFDQMKQLYNMQKKAKDLQKQMEAIKAEKSKSGITVTVNGAQRVESVQIGHEWLTVDKKLTLEKALRDVINEAFEEIQKQTASQAAALMKDLKGLNIPGL